MMKRRKTIYSILSVWKWVFQPYLNVRRTVHCCSREPIEYSTPLIAGHYSQTGVVQKRKQRTRKISILFINNRLHPADNYLPKITQRLNHYLDFLFFSSFKTSSLNQITIKRQSEREKKKKNWQLIALWPLAALPFFNIFSPEKINQLSKCCPFSFPCLF